MKRALGLLSLLAIGCTRAAAPAAHEPVVEAASSCDGLGALVDLHREVATSPTHDHAPLAALTDVQSELAAAHVALAAMSPDDSARPSVEHLAGLLEERRAMLVTTTRFAHESHAAASAALRDATTCRGVHFDALSKDSKKKEKTEDLALARSKACEPTLRVWAIVDGLDLSSGVSASRAAAQLGELRLDEATSRARDRLKSVLERHVKNLRALEAASDTSVLVDARNDVRDATESSYRTCLTHRDAQKLAKTAPRDPRSATVMVRPTWSGALKRLPSAAGLRFGSGFVVRWNAGTFVVTNRHVMDGAVEAEILFAADVESAKRDRKTTRSAKLVAADESDDVAVLRLDDADARLPSLALRLDPVREQENVVAAGFPGIGAMPSFQVTRGVVSNAHFASEEQDAGIAYLQHTAAIDPGNSGGPLLDDGGRLVGMNTAKMRGRENVSFAIPTSRVRFALTRAEHPRRFQALHAEAACNVALDALAADRPTMTSVRRFGLALFDETAHRAYPELREESESPIDDARVRAFEAVREAVEGDGGIAPFATCTDIDVARGKEGGFAATVRTRSGTLYRVGLRSETDELRVVSFARAM